ncbi:hypothetical protein Q5M85_00300 [Paraclostridium bifermentans]|nr:hypothetical protein [Paraclostridium bifermentans]
MDSRYKDVKHQYKVKKDKLEYIVTVTTLEKYSEGTLFKQIGS